MRSNTTKLAIAVSGALFALACSHAQPVPTQTADATDAGVYEVQGSPKPPMQESLDGASEGSKLAAKDEGDAKSSDAPKPAAPPPHTASPEVKAAFARATQAATEGDVETAIASLKSAIAQDSRLPWAHFDLGALYERKGQFAIAQDEYKKALDLDPQFGDAAFAEARLLTRQKRGTEAQADLRSRIEKEPAALGLRNALVYTLVEAGQLDAAVVEAKKVLKSDEKNAEAMSLLASVYYKQGKNELAQMVLTNAMAIRPEDPQIHNAMGFVHIALKEKAKALEDFKQAAALSPDFAEAHNNLGALLNEAQDYSSAVKELELAVRDAPDFVSARLNLGNAYRGNQQYDRALTEYQKVLELAPSHKDVLFNLAVLYFDGQIGQLSLTDRLNKASAYFDQYQGAGGSDARIEQYRKDLAKQLATEKRRQERESKDKLKKAQKDKADAAKADADAAARAKAAESAPAAPTASTSIGAPGTAPSKAPGLAPAPTPAPAAADGAKLKEQDPAPSPSPAPASGGKLGAGDEK